MVGQISGRYQGLNKKYLLFSQQDVRNRKEVDNVKATRLEQKRGENPSVVFIGDTPPLSPKKNPSPPPDLATAEVYATSDPNAISTA